MTNTQSPYLIIISLTHIICIFIQIIYLNSAIKMIGVVFYKNNFHATNHVFQL